MLKKLNKYPILITTIVSCAIIVMSLFILGFFGLRLGVSYGNGTQVEVTLADETKVNEYSSKISEVLSDYDLCVDAKFVEDKFIATEEKGELTRKCLVVQAVGTVSEENATQIKTTIAEKLELNADNVVVGKVTSSVTAKDVLRLGLGLAIVAVALFVFALIRYDIFAGITFVIVLIHNIIIYFSVTILTRIPFTVYSLVALILLTLLVCVALLAMFEKFRDVSKQQDANKISATKRMIDVEDEAVKPFAYVAIAVAVFAVIMLFVPVTRICMFALGLILCLIVSAYTLTLVGPSAYVALIEIRDMNRKAVLSRNEKVNKAIKKKIKKNANAANNDAKK